MGRKYRDAERNNMGWGGPLESHLRKRIQPGQLFMKCQKMSNRRLALALPRRLAMGPKAGMQKTVQSGGDFHRQ